MKITPREKRRHAAGREKNEGTDKAQAFDPSRPTDFVLTQLRASNGIRSLIELSSGNCRGYLLQVKENPDTNSSRLFRAKN